MNTTAGQSADYTGAKAALSGFRRQALFTLHLLLTEAGSDTVIQPEGQEDVSVIKKNKACRAIQVKAYSADLTLSALEPQKPHSFLRRAARNMLEDCVYELASFGPLGPELAQVQDKDEGKIDLLKDRLKNKHGYSAAEAEIIAKIKIVSIDEKALQDEIDSYLARTLAAGNPTRAFDLLTAWIYQAAENRSRLTLTDLRARLSAIGRYFSERESHRAEWFNTIEPLEREDFQGERLADLANQYYRGAAARYSHICAGLDVKRTSLLEKIFGAFKRKKVVVLHGASGQGKSSLALRYLHDYVPDEWSFAIRRVDNRRHATQIASAICDHLHSVDASIYLFIDVTHRDLDWVELVKDLLDKPNVKILIAIREEDLARQTVANQELDFPEDIPLEFAEDEAQNIYLRLLEMANVTNPFPTFAEAWRRFGAKGPLLEFVYLITQTQSLRDVLKLQIRRLRNEVQEGQLESKALAFLNVCAVATAYEARLNLRSLAQHLGMTDPIGVLNRFESEYLLRQADKLMVEAIHPVRSEILADLLDDEAFSPRSETILAALQFIPETDLEVYLLFSFSRNKTISDQLTERLLSRKPLTWAGAAGIGRALLWAGIRGYIDENWPVFERISSIGDKAWLVGLPTPVSPTGENISDTVLAITEKENPARAVELRACSAALTSSKQIFVGLSKWLKLLDIQNAPEALADWEGLAELSYWSGYLGCEPIGLQHLLSIPIQEIPMDTLGRACTALFSLSPDAYGNLMSASGEEVRHRYQTFASVIKLEEASDRGSITAHFIVPLYLIRGQEAPQAESDHGTKSKLAPVLTVSPETLPLDRIDTRLHDESMLRASLLKSLFPNLAGYYTQGYGHNLDLLRISWPHDSTHKRLMPDAMPVPWLVRINRIYCSLVELRSRPQTWSVYANLILQLRSAVATVLERLERSLVSYFGGTKMRTIIGEPKVKEAWSIAKKLAARTIALPSSAFDEWGFSSENDTGSSSTLGAKSAGTLGALFAVRNNRPLSKALSDYSTAVDNFLAQGEDVCAAHGRFGRYPLDKRAEVKEALTAFGYLEDKARLAIYNLFRLMEVLPELQSSFAQRLSKLSDPEQVANVSARERKLFPRFWALWFIFCKDPFRIFDCADTRSHSQFDQERIRLRDSLVQTTSVLEYSSVSFLSEAIPSGRNLVIRMEIRNFFELDNARAELFMALNEVLAGLGIGTLARYALDYFWPMLTIIPTYEGEAFGATGYLLPSSAFSLEPSEVSCDRPWTRVLQPLESFDEISHGIRVGSFERAPSNCSRLEEGLGNVSMILAHISTFNGIPAIEGVGLAVLQEYLNGLSKELSLYLEDVRTLLPVVTEELELAYPGESLCLALLSLLRDLEEFLLAAGDEFTFTLSNSERDCQLFLSASAAIASLRLLTPTHFRRLAETIGEAPTAGED